MREHFTQPATAEAREANIEQAFARARAPEKAHTDSADAELRALAKELAKGEMGRKFGGELGCFSAVKFAADRGLNPITSLNKIRIDRGGIVVNQDIALAIAYNSGKVSDIDEFFLVRDLVTKQLVRRCVQNGNCEQLPLVAVCRITRSDIPTMHEQTFSMVEAERAGLVIYQTDDQGARTGFGKMSTPWKHYTGRMLQQRARGFAINSLLNDTQEGILTEETDFLGIDYSDDKKEQKAGS